ncbi:MAG TPA: amino acid ABC transporter permease, partial [Geomobilimonas sp.]|nr:amino acid ABC transporter permease [Geomobilimonas sp.]
MQKTFSRVATALLFLWMTATVAFGATVDPDRLVRQANELMGQGDLAGAVEVLKKIPAPTSGGEGEAFVRSRLQIARLHFSLGEMDKALTAAREVLVLYP